MMRHLQGFSWARWWSMVLKEFLQLRRDRITFGMIVGLPIMQLALFGYAINTESQADAHGRHHGRPQPVHPQLHRGNEVV